MTKTEDTSDKMHKSRISIVDCKHILQNPKQVRNYKVIEDDILRKGNV
jgi:hypothetical protein